MLASACLIEEKERQTETDRQTADSRVIGRQRKSKRQTDRQTVILSERERESNAPNM